MDATDSFEWTVTNTNQEPTFDQNLGDRTDAEGDLISLDAGATDLDGDTLTYAATGLPAGLSIDTASGLISGTIALNAAAGSPYSGRDHRQRRQHRGRHRQLRAGRSPTPTRSRPSTRTWATAPMPRVTSSASTPAPPTSTATP